MKNLISISTGLVYKFTSDRNEMIQLLKKYSPDGIEISFADPQYLFDFHITEENIQYLKSLSWVTLHAPWLNIRYSNNETCHKTLLGLEKLYSLIGAKNVTIEPREIDDYGIFEKYKFKVSIENADYRKPFNSPVEIKQILKDHPSLGFTFDFAHALTVESSYLEEFLSIKEMTQVHMAYFGKELLDHSFLFNRPSDRIEKLIAKIPEGIPIVLECVAEEEGQIEWVRQEIDYLRHIRK